MFSFIYRSAIILLSVYAIMSVFPIVQLHWSKQVSCPTIGVIPACYLVFLGYVGILLSVLLTLFFKTFSKNNVLFLISWLIVSLFAVMGVFGEFTNLWHCPKTTTGIPKCFLSASVALIIGGLFWRVQYTKVNFT
jgi:hypothetical protein